VVLATGTIGYWPDVDSYYQCIRGWGLPVCVMEPSDRHVVEQCLVSRWERGLTGPIVLVGYSQGAAECIRLSRHLRDCGIPVRSLILLECGCSMQVPCNVQYCFNLYTSNPLTDPIPIWRGLPVRADDPGTVLINFDARRCLPPEDPLHRQRHLALGRSPEARSILLAEVSAAFGGCGGLP
jgi:hypothetical protein